jgi:hypothetical protein
MGPEEFISALRLVVRDAAIESTVSVLEHPPGRNPPQELREASEWFRSLDSNHRRLLLAVIAGAVDQTVFGILCVLDGVRAVESGQKKGRLELRYVGEATVLINSQEEPMLHDLYDARSTDAG